MEIIWRFISSKADLEGERGEWGKGARIKKYNWEVQNRQGDVKNSRGNGEAKELICTTHGHELSRVTGEESRVLGGVGQRGKNWDNCNSIIYKNILVFF